MNYFGYMPNDFINGQKVCVSFWCAGCPHHCPGCHNQEMWDFNGGKEVPSDIKGQIIKAISANGIQRNFSVLGGEPLCPQNTELVHSLVTAVRIAYPHIKIFLWTGYTIEEIKKRVETDNLLKEILQTVDTIIDGPFIQEQRDLTLELRGSRNQRILHRGKDF